VLGLYRQAIAHGEFINPSELAVTEAMTYIYYEGGGIGPACLSNEHTNARATHGDRVIADALALYGSKNVDKPRQTKPTAPYRSAAYREKKIIGSKKKKNKGWRHMFQFAGN
jgi:hypothetical protein